MPTELVERFSRDADVRIRRSAPADERLSNPALPEAVMHHLLDATEIDGGSARAALE